MCIIIVWAFERSCVACILVFGAVSHLSVDWLSMAVIRQELNLFVNCFFVIVCVYVCNNVCVSVTVIVYVYVYGYEKCLCI